MWYVVVMACRLHWNSEYDRVFSSIVYAVSAHMALDLAEQDAFDRGYGAVGWHEVVACGLTEPKVVLTD